MRSGSRKWRVQPERHTVFQTHQESFSSPHLSSGSLVISHGVLECPSLNDPLFRFQFQFVFSDETTKKVMVQFRESATRALRGKTKQTGFMCIFFTFCLSIPLFITYL